MIIVDNASGGLQSTAMVNAAIKGLIERPHQIVFANTGWERQATYDTIAEVEKLARREGIPFKEVSNGNIREQAIEAGNPNSTYGDWRDTDGYGFLKMPVYTIDNLGNKKMSAKRCTTDFKIRPIQDFLKSEYGMGPFLQRMGISLDETSRMRKSKLKYITFDYPLVFQLKWARSHCIEFLKSINVPVPSKSACIGCPLHSKNYWALLNDKEKADVIDYDEHIRHMQAHVDTMPKPKRIPDGQLTLIDMNEVDEYIGMYPLEKRQETELFTHRDGVPVADVISDDYEEVQLEYDPEDELGCGGDCFI